MLSILSYRVRILGMNKIFTKTFRIYRQAVCFIVSVLQENWDEINRISKQLDKKTFIESLIHNTKHNKAKYDFDEKFYKFPSYLRRAAIADALGVLQSFVSNGNDVMGFRVSKRQKFMPCLYDDGMFSIDLENCTAKIKLFYRGDWVWVTVRLRKTDLNYLSKKGCLFKAPVLVRKKGKVYLQFIIQEEVELSDRKDVITAVDLGLNHDAVCSVMHKDGTVQGRKFINFQREKDHLNSILDRIKEKQKRGESTKNDWSYFRVLNRILADMIASAIVDFAESFGSDVIVFEHLDMKGKKTVKGPAKQKVSLWRKNDIQNRCEYKAHRKGMRIARVFARCTSALAFDGSGFVQRGKDAGFKNNKLCRFSTGKVYNADLSASYNIGARYFIKQIVEKLSDKIIRTLQAKVPDLSTRTKCTLDTLIRLNAELSALS